MRDDLQELVDEVSRVLAAPATLEDAEFTLLAFCAHDDSAAGAMDAVRTRSILTRGSPPATRQWFEEFGIASADGPLRTPADDVAGILTRLVLPVRHAGRTRGYLWLLDGDLRPAGALTAASLARLPSGSTAGVSQVRRGTAELPEQWREARAAARVAAAVPHLSPVAHWAELGAWRLVSDLPGPDPAVVPLLTDALLTGTAEVFLDCGASASRAAGTLRVHRQTLYYRLARISELTGLDLADGDARLLLHASLRAARLTPAH
jgi:hypothetical protein